MIFLKVWGGFPFFGTAAVGGDLTEKAGKQEFLHITKSDHCQDAAAWALF